MCARFRHLWRVHVALFLFVVAGKFSSVQEEEEEEECRDWPAP